MKTYIHLILLKSIKHEQWDLMDLRVQVYWHWNSYFFPSGASLADVLQYNYEVLLSDLHLHEKHMLIYYNNSENKCQEYGYLKVIVPNDWKRFNQAGNH